MKTNMALLALLGAVSAMQLQSKSSSEEAFISASTILQSGMTPEGPDTTANVLVEGTNSQQQYSEAVSFTDSARRKKKKSKSPTTLTIVQDFPKKPVDGLTAPLGVEMIKKSINNVDVEDPTDHSKTTLTIVQDFRKKETDISTNGVEMVQSQDKIRD